MVKIVNKMMRMNRACFRFVSTNAGTSLIFHKRAMSTEVDSGGPETVPNPDYASDETTSLLVCMSVNSDADSSRVSQFKSPRPQERESTFKNGNKPMLIRQDCTTSRLSVASPRPLLSSSGGIGCVSSEESGTGVVFEENNVRSVPDIELHCRMNEDGSIATPKDGGNGADFFHPNGISSPRLRVRGSSVTSYGHLSPRSRCRCDLRRESNSRLSSLARSISRESVRSIGNQQVYQCTPYSAPPAVLLTTTSSSSRVIRQSSQPETSLSKFVKYKTCIAITCCRSLLEFDRIKGNQKKKKEKKTFIKLQKPYGIMLPGENLNA